MRQLFHRDGLPPVFYLQESASPLPAQQQAHRRPRRRIFHGVIQQDIRQAAQLHGAAPHCQLRLDVVAKLPAALKGHRLKGQGTLQHRVRQIYSVQGLLCPALRPGQGQHILHQGLHPQGFGANPLHILFGLLRIPLSSRQLRRGKDHRQRCFQLMGRI